MTDTPNTMHTTVYSPDGFKLNIVLAITAVADITAHLDAIRALGLTPNLPGLEPGQEKEAIMTVVRRASNTGVPIIDFYPHWQYENKFGYLKYGHLYLDTPDDVAEFEAQSGLKLADLPLYEGQQAIQRKHGHATRFEVNVKRTFGIVRTPDGQHDNGMPRYLYSYAAPASLPPRPEGEGAGGEGEPVNPFLSEDAQFLIRAALASAKMDKNGAYEYILAYALPNRAIKKFSEAHPHLTVEQLLERIITLSAEYHKKPVEPAAEVIDQSAAPAAEPQFINDPLRDEMLEITAVEPRTGKRSQWTAYLQFDGHSIQFTLYNEDKRAIDRAGYDTSKWNLPDGQRYMVEGISVITTNTLQGRKLVSVWDHKHKRLIEVRPTDPPTNAFMKDTPHVSIPANKVKTGDLVAHVDGRKEIEFAIAVNVDETQVRYIQNGETKTGTWTSVYNVTVISGPSFDAAQAAQAS